MIYAIIGADSSAAIHKLQEIKAAFLKKHPGASLHELEGEDTDVSLLSLLGERSMFSPKRLMILKRFCDADAMAQRMIMDHMLLLQNSPDVFVFWERGVNPGDEFLQAVQNSATKVQMAHKRSNRARPVSGNQVFQVVDRIFAKPASGTAVCAEALHDFGASDILSTMLWKLKTIFLAQQGEEKSLKPFVAQRAHAAGQFFYKEQIPKLLRSGIITDAMMKKDAAHVREHLERFTFALGGKKGAI